MRRLIFSTALLLCCLMGSGPTLDLASAGTSTFVLCDADLDEDGDVDLADVALFASDYYSGEHPDRSNFDGVGGITIIDVQYLATAVGVTGCN